MNTIKVLIVDDSAVVRQVLAEIVNAAYDMHVCAAVADPIFAKKRMQMNWPDVIVLDVNMPRMDGIQFLKQIMSERPTPVVMCSALTTEGSETALKALAAGAIEIIAKPKLVDKNNLIKENSRIIEAIRCAAHARNLHRLKVSQDKFSPQTTHIATTSPLRKRTPEGIIVAMGTSTGGTQALEEILTRLPAQCPPLLIVQHMPANFTAAFAKRLDGICAIEVREALSGDLVRSGRALIAPGGRHMKLKISNDQYIVVMDDSEPINRHKPSVDVLFYSVARYAGRNAIGIIMTGMGNDGAYGLKEMYDCGAYTLAQDESTSVVFGMAKEAIELNAVAKEVGLDDISNEIMNYGIRQSA
jgi:two-component system chemotaxis response regulator CheB